MAAAIAPITGVSHPTCSSPHPRSEASELYCFYSMLRVDAIELSACFYSCQIVLTTQQALRRGLVLELSTAFGESTLFFPRIGGVVRHWASKQR